MKSPLRVDLGILNQIARIANHDLELRPMLQRITDTLAHAFAGEFVALISLSDDRRILLDDVREHANYVETLPGGLSG